MDRTVGQHPTATARAFPRIVVAALVAGTLALVAGAADAAFTTGACLAGKRAAWVNLRKCQGAEQVKQLKGKPADLGKCQTKFQEKLAKIAAKATKAAIACRYGANNSDGTVTDYDTGLEWEQKNGDPGGVCFLVQNVVNRCVNFIYSWDDANVYIGSLNGTTDDGTVLAPPFAGHTDWRLPTILELRSILDTTVAGCNSGGPCIDPVFGPTVADVYYSATRRPIELGQAWLVVFSDGVVSAEGDSSRYYVRGVRSSL